VEQAQHLPQRVGNGNLGVARRQGENGQGAKFRQTQSEAWRSVVKQTAANHVWAQPFQGPDRALILPRRIDVHAPNQCFQPAGSRLDQDDVTQDHRLAPAVAVQESRIVKNRHRVGPGPDQDLRPTLLVLGQTYPGNDLEVGSQLAAGGRGKDRVPAADAAPGADGKVCEPVALPHFSWDDFNPGQDRSEDGAYAVRQRDRQPLCFVRKFVAGLDDQVRPTFGRLLTNHRPRRDQADRLRSNVNGGDVSIRSEAQKLIRRQLDQGPRGIRDRVVSLRVGETRRPQAGQDSQQDPGTEHQKETAPDQGSHQRSQRAGRHRDPWCAQANTHPEDRPQDGAAETSGQGLALPAGHSRQEHTEEQAEQGAQDSSFLSRGNVRSDRIVDAHQGSDQPHHKPRAKDQGRHLPDSFFHGITFGSPVRSGQGSGFFLKGRSFACYNQTIPREPKGKAKAVSTREPPPANINAPSPDSMQKRKPDRPRGKGSGILFLLLAVAASFAAGTLIERHAPLLPNRSAQSSRQDSSSRPISPETLVVALGRLEPEGGVIGVAGSVGDRLASVLVEEGAKVVEGQELACLESYQDRLAEKNLADSQLQEAIARRQALKNSGELLVELARIQIERVTKESPFVLLAQEAKVRLLESQLESANKEMARLQSISQAVSSPQLLNQQHNAVRQAKEELTAAQAVLGKLKAEQPLNLLAAQNQLRTAEADLARSQVEGPLDSLKKAAALAQSRLRHSIIRAPRSGKVLKILGHPGEACTGPILQLANVREMVVIAEVYETDRGRIREGCKATIRSPALPHELTGAVRSIGGVLARNQIFDLNPTADADRRVVEVKIRLGSNDDAPTSAGRSRAEADYVHLQVTVTITPKKPDQE
jgi:HlyD family secretion protein